MAKETLGVKVPSEWKEKIQQICTDLGITPSEWLSDLIGRELGETNVNQVHSLSERLASVEKKLSGLSSLLSR